MISPSRRLLRWLPIAVLAAGLPAPVFAAHLSGAVPFTATTPLAANCTPTETLAPKGTKLFRYPPTGETTVREAFPPAASLSWSIDGAPDITAMSRTVASVLDFNAVRFPNIDPGYTAFLPGELYQEVYGRDMSTIAKAAQYLYGDSFLRAGAEQFLAHQLTAVAQNAEFSRSPYPGPGALPGYIGRDGKGDKTTSVSDEEGSIIQLSYLYYSIRGGADWLTCDINGVTVLERMNRAANALLQGRMNPATGLIKRSFTTDWGDVRRQGGVNPTIADPISEQWTASIYDQAWTYLALRQLAEMNRTASQPAMADRWEQTAAAIKDATNRLLWMPDRGYYRIHLQLTPVPLDFDEDAIIAIGNAVAVYAGLTDQQQTSTVLVALERARLRAASLKPGLSLDPPYFQGFFFHHLQYESGRYQNGGQWDWWGGVQMTAEFEAGYSALAWQHLASLAQDWATHPNDVGEWQVPSTNKMEGSHKYAGAAGTVSEAVVRGAFGVKLSREGFELNPRLGHRSAYLQLMQPASGRSLWYRQRMLGDTLVAQYSVSHDSMGQMALLLPATMAVAGVTLDGVARPFTVTATGQDRFADLGTVPPGAHTVRLQLTPYAGDAAAVAWVSNDIPRAVIPDASLKATVRVFNAGASGWPRLGDGAVSLAYRWLPKPGSPSGPAATGASPLPRTIDASQSADITFPLDTPSRPGDYRLQVDMVAPGATAFASASPEHRLLEIPVTVTDTRLAATLDPWSSPGLARAGRDVTVGFTVHNDGTVDWDGARTLRVITRWTLPDGRPADDGASGFQDAPLPVGAGAATYVPLTLTAPRRVGNYRLTVQLTAGASTLPVATLQTYEVTVTP